MKIVDCFNWYLSDIEKELPNFKHQGFDVVQLPPIQYCKPGNEWYKLFQNYDIQTIGNRLGTEEDWIRVNYSAHALGLKTCTCIQLRHVAGMDNGVVRPHELVPQKIAKFYKGVDEYRDDKNRHHVTEGNWGLPRLDYENEELIFSEYIPFLDKIFEHSDYARLDEGKHIGLPSEGYKIWSILYQRYGHKIIAECINEREDILNEYAKYCWVLTEEGIACPKGTVRFVESHDTYLNEWGYTRNLSDDRVLYLFEQSCKKHHNVMFYLRPFNDTWRSQRMYDILHNKENKC